MIARPPPKYMASPRPANSVHSFHAYLINKPEESVATAKIASQHATCCRVICGRLTEITDYFDQGGTVPARVARIERQRNPGQPYAQQRCRSRVSLALNPGYEAGIVVRQVDQTSNGTVINNYGEGTSALQSPSTFEGRAFGPDINGVWTGQVPSSSQVSQSPSK
jgi:hypothetical protein